MDIKDWKMTYIDPVESSPNNYKVLQEDDNVRMLEMIVAPGESDNLHSHPSEAVYFITGGKARVTVDGEEMEMELPDGASMLHGAWTHQVTNVGDTVIRAIIVETKG
jgi:mannose-6-phosphate isomerase-like protein (cupin superfamily)